MSSMPSPAPDTGRSITNRWEQTWDLFYQALEVEPDERDAFLRRACGEDDALLAELRELVALHGEAPDLPRISHRPDEDDLDEPLIGESIGPFRLTRVVGEGGMGIVFEAEQTEPVRRRVALKLIRQGMDTRETLARFRAERQALAVMEHPNIARVLEAGATAEGRPYFVMEYVDGPPVTNYCDRQRLATGERLKIFEQVCDGVQHAHQRGVIHRDLKPSNVLVETHDGKPVPKIIDFGVAKATARQQLERTAFTELGRLIGTPEYMSPEQAVGTGGDIDTRTDVYSLGVILYELLAGVQPIDSESLRRGGIDEIYRRIREEEPPRPSARFSGLTAERTTDVAARRDTDPRGLVLQLKGDLDWVTMKALAKERDRRYGSPAEFAADVRRFRQHHPVEARPPSVRYRAGKFARRHRLAVSAALAVAIALVVGGVVSGLSILRVIDAERSARQEAATAQRVSDFLVELFSTTDPVRSRGREITVREVLDRGAARIRDSLADEPLIRARMLHTIANIYTNLGHYEQALSMLEEAIAIRREILPPDDYLIFDAIADAAVVQGLAGDIDGKLESFRAAHAIALENPGTGDRNVAFSLAGIADALTELDRQEEARPLQEQVVTIRERSDPDGRPLALALRALARTLAEQGDRDTARTLYERALTIQEPVLDDFHPEVQSTLNSLAILYWEQQDFAGARPYFERVLASVETIYGPDHPRTSVMVNNMGRLLTDLGELEEAETHLLRALTIQEQRLRPDHPELATTVLNLGRVYGLTDRYDEAIELYERGLAIREESLGSNHSRLAMSFEGFARLLAKAGQPDRAAEYESRARAIREGGNPVE